MNVESTKKKYVFNVFADLRIVMTGMTGVGKSSLGNSIFGANFDPSTSGKFERPFKSKASSQSVTKQCSMRNAKVLDRNIRVVDTPGFFDTKVPYWETIREVSKCTLQVEPGPHAILFVVKIGRFTEEVVRSISTMKMVFGDDCINFLIILFTGADDLSREDPPEVIENYVGSLDDQYKKLLHECNLRYIAFDNTYNAGTEENKEQVNKLIKLVEQTIKDNDGRYYTNAMLQKATAIMEEEKAKKDRELEEEEKRKRDLDEREKKLEEDKLALEQQKDIARREQDIEYRTRMLEETEYKLNLMAAQMEEMKKEQMKSDMKREVLQELRADQAKLAEEAISNDRHKELEPHMGQPEGNREDGKKKKCIVM